jgi:arsenic resistance protein ArsH
MGDLNNTAAARAAAELKPDLSYLHQNFAIPESEDEAEIRKTYRPFILSPEVTSSDWIAALELSTALKIAEEELTKSGGDRLKVLVLYGSLRSR